MEMIVLVIALGLAGAGVGIAVLEALENLSFAPASVGPSGEPLPAVTTPRQEGTPPALDNHPRSPADVGPSGETLPAVTTPPQEVTPPAQEAPRQRPKRKRAQTRAESSATLAETAAPHAVRSANERPYLRLVQPDGELIHSPNRDAPPLCRVPPKVVSLRQPDSSTRTPQEELAAMIGMEEIKKDVQRIVALTKMRKRRKAGGHRVAPYCYHAVLIGNPGTGKTTFARIYGQILRDLGVLKKGHFVEARRGDLVAEYLGQTAPKVEGVVKKAVGGVLFIDEAYSLARDERDCFALEAIDTLVPLIENHRDELVVLLAGYENEMRTFIDSNPGLSSRFTTYLKFTDYTPEELIRILDATTDEYDYELSADARQRAFDEFHRAYETRTRDFGNARLARVIFEKAMTAHALRLEGARAGKSALRLLEASDIPALEELKG